MTAENINPLQLIGDLPQHHAVPRHGFSFNVNTLPPEWEWGQCSILACGIDGPNSCQEYYTPASYVSSQFTISYTCDDYDVTFLEYDNYPVAVGEYLYTLAFNENVPLS